FDSPEFAEILAEAKQPNGGRLPARLLRQAGASPGWVRGALSAAAIVLIFGAALVIKQGLFTPATSGQHSAPTLGGSPDVKPLAQGTRIVYAHDDSLWSAPENGPGVAERLTPRGIRIGAWSVAPDGAHVAYVDSATGRIHVVRSDDQDDAATDNISITSD